MKTLFLILIFVSTKCVSQIYFSPNAIMFVKNEVLFVQQDINLSSNSNLFLRNNAQLLQGTTGTSNNTGLGVISVYQEGTSDNYDYNYWCSPVGNASAAYGNENFGITMLGRPTTSIATAPAIILPVSNYDGISNPLSISSKWIYKLLNANNYSQWIFVGGTMTLAPGEGFSMKGTSGTDNADPELSGVTNNPGGAQRYDFRGKPNDGNISISLGINSATLTGNPYPSALHLNAFLLDPANTATGGIAYFWEQDKTVDSHKLINYRGGYGSYSPVDLTSSGVYVPATFDSYNANASLNTTGTSSGLMINRRYSPIGQGFVINATANGTATFKNAHRVFITESVGSSKFEKHIAAEKNNEKGKTTEEVVKEVSHFKLNTIINNQFTRQLALVFHPQATDSVDLGIDALNLDDAFPNDVSFWLENAGYVIQGVNYDETKKIPLIVKATTSSTFKFYIPEVINFDNSQPVYIYDDLDQSYHDIKNNSYEVLVGPGTYSDRFKITFNKQLTLNVGSESTKEFYITHNNNSSNLKAFNPNSLGLKSFKLYDILGKVVLSKKDLGTEQNYIFSTSGLSSGIYIAEFLSNDNDRFTEKIIISNFDK